jgi:diguanylate cyclase (GGDEF)-like protein
VSIAAMVALFLCVLAFSVFNTVREADAVDAERSRQAVSAAVQGEIDKLVSIADDNGVWDDAARVAYGGLTDTDFLWGSWGVSTAEAKLFDTVFIVDHGGAPLFAYHKGRPIRLDPSVEYGRSFDAMLAQMDRGETAAGGIARTREGLVVLGVSDILPTSPSLNHLVPATGAFRIAFAKPFDAKTAGQIGKALLLEDARLGADDRSAVAVRLKDAAGANVGYLTWSASRPGLSALERALPWIALAAVLHLLIAGLVTWQAAGSARRLAAEALSDSLSGLPNRRALRRGLKTQLARGERLGLAMIDLDGFKEINDNFGHSVGDRLIKLVAELLTRLAGKDAMVSRLGGDEFAVLAAGQNALVTLERISQALLDHVARPFRIDERTVLVGASIGLASAGIREFDASEMMRRADVAMYAAKAAGKMRLYWYDEMLDQQRASAQVIESELKAAIEADGFDIVYQPVLNVKSGAIEAVEALLRWQSPTRGEVCPSEFIPVAEETGLIDRIGMLVLRRACADALDWDGVRLAVNVSPAQLRNPDFAPMLSALLEEIGFPPSRLELEITETYLVDEAARARKVIAAIQATGVAVALDDFGSGFASMNFLRTFGLTRFKIDGALTAEAARTVEGEAIVQATIIVAHTLGIQIAAEGIETETQADLMRIAGCDELQGWLISRPIAAREIGERLVSEGPLSGRRLRVV